MNDVTPLNLLLKGRAVGVGGAIVRTPTSHVCRVVSIAVRFIAAAGAPTGSRRVHAEVCDAVGERLWVTVANRNQGSNSDWWYVAHGGSLSDNAGGDFLNWMPMPPLVTVPKGGYLRAFDSFARNPNDTIHLAVVVQDWLQPRDAHIMELEDGSGYILSQDSELLVVESLP